MASSQEQNPSVQQEVSPQEASTSDFQVRQHQLAELGFLTAGILHEIKNPLNFIGGFATLSSELLAEFQETLPPGALPPVSVETLGELQDNIAKIVGHVQRLTKLIEQLLRQAKGSNSPPSPVNLHELLDEVSSLVYQGMRGHLPRFTVKSVKEYHPTTLFVQFIPEELWRLFHNLIVNAFYSMAKKVEHSTGNYQPELQLTSQIDGEWIVIQIIDNGLGFSEEVGKHLFEPFFSTKPTDEGTGLGLTLCLQIAEKYGGTLRAESVDGMNARFTVQLPVQLLTSQ